MSACINTNTPIAWSCDQHHFILKDILLIMYSQWEHILLGFTAFWCLSWTAWQGWLQLTLICICKWPENSFRLPNANEAIALLPDKMHNIIQHICSGDRLLKPGEKHEKDFLLSSTKLRSYCLWWVQGCFYISGPPYEF